MGLLISALFQYSEHYVSYYTYQFSVKNKKKNIALLHEIKKANLDFVSRIDYVKLRSLNWMLEHQKLTRLSCQGLMTCCRLIQIASLKNYFETSYLVKWMLFPSLLETATEFIHEIASEKSQAYIEEIRKLLRTINRIISACLIYSAAMNVIKFPPGVTFGSYEFDRTSFIQQTLEMIKLFGDLYKAGGILNVLNFCIGIFTLAEACVGIMCLLYDIYAILRYSQYNEQPPPHSVDFDNHRFTTLNQRLNNWALDMQRV